MSSSLKIAVRETLKAILPSTCEPIVIASMGRSGSTLVYDSVVEGMSAVRFGSGAGHLAGLVRDAAWRLEGASFRKGRVYKTHDFPRGLAAGETPKTVFLFGSASDAARSVLNCETTYGRDWIREHFEHLSASGPFEDVPVRDVLRFGEQLESWLSCTAVPVLALRYEYLWDSGAEAVLSRFLGFPVRLPVRRKRDSAARSFGEKGALLAETYAELDRRISALPPIIANGRAQELLRESRVG